jgi:hypothetical protein
MHWRSTIGYYRASSVARAFVLVSLIAAPGRGQEAKNNKTSSGSEKVVQEQVEAYNHHDIEAFLKTYSPEVKVFDFPDNLRFSGLEAMRERYGKVFKSDPAPTVKIAKRIVQGDHVIDHEEVSRGAERQLTAVAIYRVDGGKITAVWFLR